eukprot:358823-Pelagomonas_calceolata.AAC.1
MNEPVAQRISWQRRAYKSTRSVVLSDAGVHKKINFTRQQQACIKGRPKGLLFKVLNGTRSQPGPSPRGQHVGLTRDEIRVR